MIAHHFVTDEIPRQCVTPGDYIIHDGDICIASVNNIRKRRLYIRCSDSASKYITDHMVKVIINKDGLPVREKPWWQ
ncbi:cell division protein FtsZ [Escherichia coli]|uniref:Uncharacterized protein n=3 Tax=Escherichia coli TA447 TaxID=656447 RepID=A0A1X3J175_ECOLX|nr:cell division protein FtsZ [Escherichia coli]OSK93980.1 hypothetical protein ECXG_05470 [Escherichia coli TA447]